MNKILQIKKIIHNEIAKLIDKSEDGVVMCPKCGNMALGDYPVSASLGYMIKCDFCGYVPKTSREITEGVAIKYPKPLKTDAEISNVIQILKRNGIHAVSSAEFNTHVIVNDKDKVKAEKIISAIFENIRKRI